MDKKVATKHRNIVLLLENEKNDFCCSLHAKFGFFFVSHLSYVFVVVVLVDHLTGRDGIKYFRFHATIGSLSCFLRHPHFAFAWQAQQPFLCGRRRQCEKPPTRRYVPFCGIQGECGQTELFSRFIIVAMQTSSRLLKRCMKHLVVSSLNFK